MDLFCFLCEFRFEVLYGIIRMSKESKFLSKRELKFFPLSYLLERLSLKIAIHPLKIFQLKKILFIKLCFSFPVSLGLF